MILGISPDDARGEVEVRNLFETALKGHPVLLRTADDEDKDSEIVQVFGEYLQNTYAVFKR